VTIDLSAQLARRGGFGLLRFPVVAQASLTQVIAPADRSSAVVERSMIAHVPPRRRPWPQL
jgi:hypothetical protein